MELTNYNPSSRIERFQALEPGMYWRAKEAVEGDKIPPGTVLLLTNIDFFEGKPHTINLDGHPLLHPNSVFSFLLDDFLAKFELALDADDVRAREIATLQAEINRLQSELMEGQASPALMAPYVAEKVLEWEKKNNIDSTSSVPALSHHEQTISTNVSAAIGQRMTIEDVNAMKVYAERHAIVAKAQADWIETRTTAIAKTFSKMSPFFQEKASVALAKTKHIRDYAASIMKGLESMDLYIGKGVDVVTIATGESASADQKLTLFQRKLFMDEELAAWAEVGDQFDYACVEEFDKYIANSPSLRDQIFPSPRAVVSMAVRRNNANYGQMDAYEAARRNQTNKSVFLMVRDGENIYRVYSAQPTHENTPRLFPTKDELSNLFKGVDGSDVTFNDLQFTRKAAESENVSLHYKRFLILLCGLDHRLSLFGNFYDPAEYGKFISLEFQAAHFQFVTDDEPNFMLGEGRKAVMDWFKEMNRFMQSGSRVLCYHNSLITPESAPACQKWVRDRLGNDHIKTLADPLVEFEVLIAYREDKELCVEVRAKRNTWRVVVNREFNARVSLTLARPTSYLCLDAVKTEDLEFYIYNRESRIQHIHFIRLFKKTALELKAEAKAESGARTYIRECVANAGFAGTAGLDALIDTSVRTWRAANRGKPLPTAEFKEELHPLLDHIYSLCKTADLATRAEAFAAESSITMLKLIMTGRNKLVVYAEVPEGQRDNRLTEWRWVKRLTLNVLKTKLSIAHESFVWLTDKPNAGEIELKTYENLDKWVNEYPELCKAANVSMHCDAIVGSLQGIRCDDGVHTAFSGGDREHGPVESGPGIPEAIFDRLMYKFETVLDSSKKLVNKAYIAVPIASYVEPQRNNKAPCITTVMAYDHAACWLWNFGNDTQREHVRHLFVSVHKDKQHATELMCAPMEYELSCITGPLSHSINLFGDSDGMFMHSLPHGILDAWWNSKKGLTKRESPSGFWGTHHLSARSLNHFMQTWVSSTAFAKLSQKNRVLIGQNVWDGKRSHLEKYLTAKIRLALKRGKNQ